MRSERLLEKNLFSKYVEEVVRRYLVRLTRFGYLISSVDGIFDALDMLK